VVSRARLVRGFHNGKSADDGPGRWGRRENLLRSKVFNFIWLRKAPRFNYHKFMWTQLIAERKEKVWSAGKSEVEALRGGNFIHHLAPVWRRHKFFDRLQSLRNPVYTCLSSRHMSAETLEAAGKLQSLFACKHFICFNSVSRCQLARWGRANDGVRVSLSLLLLLTRAARKFELENNVPITSSEFALHNSRLASEKTFCLVLLVFLFFFVSWREHESLP
jgi:hypothetical protein